MFARFSKFAPLVALLLIEVNAANAAIIVNGDFETDISAITSPIPSWNGDGAIETSDSAFGTFGPHSGYGFAAFNSAGGLGAIDQTIATVLGQTYVLEFWLASDGQPTNQFQALWNSDILFSQSNIPTQGYQLYTYLVTGTGSDTLNFFGQNNTGSLSLDDVSFFEATALPLAPVPEPATLAIWGGLSLLGLASSWRKKRRASA